MTVLTMDHVIERRLGDQEQPRTTVKPTARKVIILLISFISYELRHFPSPE
jgi:hypothetical protein